MNDHLAADLRIALPIKPVGIAWQGRRTVSSGSLAEARPPLSSKSTHESLLLEDHIRRLDDANFRVCFAIQNDLVLEFLRSGDIEEMLLREAIVPANVPSGEPEGISLPGSRKRGASQCLHVNVSLGIGN